MASDFQPLTPSHGFAHAHGAVRWGIAVGAVAYVGYLGLLITCDLRRVEPLGFVPQFQAGASPFRMSNLTPLVGARASAPAT